MNLPFLKTEKSTAITIALALVLLAATIHIFSYCYIHNLSCQARNSLEKADDVQEKVMNATSSSEKFLVLKNQYLICENIKDFYYTLGTTYFDNYYIFSICSITFLVLLTIAVFLLANKGWQNSSLVLKSFLISTIVISSLYYFLPTVLNNKENYQNNMNKVKTFEKIQTSILAFTNKTKPTETKKIDSIITVNYAAIAENLDFITTIDDSKLNSQMTTLLKVYQPNVKTTP